MRIKPRYCSAAAFFLVASLIVAATPTADERWAVFMLVCAGFAAVGATL